MTIAHEMRRLLWKAGYEFLRFTPKECPLARRKKLLETYSINVVLDVGANRGQFAQELRSDLKYAGRILSFEPVSSSFSDLARASIKDPNWKVFNVALGDEPGRLEIQVAGNSYSSSFLPMLQSHVDSAPDSQYIAVEVVEVSTLDLVFDDLCTPADRVYLKIDTQGFEKRVLAGGVKSLSAIDTVQLELSLVHLYEGEAPYGEMISCMQGYGYDLVSVEPGFGDAATGELLQMDGIFHRSTQSR